ncbi:guanylate cyclase [Salpingoeca rosetta]|uniref:guanylate cyclase n=1 Tax=Salpingoeca rosetta (strain ATCC 50818 / BSB-021) TaxID=946362 RepID=F2TZE3_SALR5|nr:guanylate cyclase [Salpingoeca rosetta]EGD78967.1 guanylate cyclase [Salpingoeca rosetta]|eukprot:XP_004997923.1 guanylate cyclase [Salpingoeca rosetta]
MYGLLHKALTSWVESLPDGDELLQEIMKVINFSGHPDDFFRYYSDEQTALFLSTVAKITGRSEEDCKYEAGGFFLTGILESGYGHALRTLGDDFFTMLQNLDSLHESFLPSFPKMRTPSIRPTRNPDGTMTIHYYSDSVGLAPFMMGALKACALRIYDLDIDIRHRTKKGAGDNHDVFHVFMDPRGFGIEKEVDETVNNMCNLTLSGSLTNDLFPWHFAVGRDLNVTSVGKHLGSRLKEPPVGRPAKAIFKIVNPVDVTFDFETLASLDGVSCLFKIDVKHLRDPAFATAGTPGSVHSVSLGAASHTSSQRADACPFSGNSSMASSNMSSKRSSALSFASHRFNMRAEHIKLHGQVTYHADSDCVVFFGTPALRSLEEMEAQRIELSEMPLHSHGREYLYGSMFQSASAKNSNEVDKKLAELDQSMAEVQHKKKEIDSLLHSILPPTVAGSLARGEIPPAERYQHVTVLFSDIAGFTNISSDVPATEVMDMLHELFLKFDDLADKHGCYKVETIGDAYMVAAGCPEKCEDHALRVARLAIDMVRTAQSVLSPLDGEPIRIRVGLHSGPLMAGVVGRARPRYCLFGDTVNVASRMESNGLPGCIQTSYRFTQALPPDHPLEIVARGHIDIKGKGCMKTFLVLGAHDDGDQEPLLPTESTSDDLAPKLYEMMAGKSNVEDRLAEISTSATALRNRRKQLARSHVV